jgi:multidrug efflux system membrane fusion protein
MADPELTAVLGYFRRMAAEGGGVRDAELLGRFAASRDEAAFELLVWRHAPLVYGVCRRILHDVHDAEDAFQATFLALARHADRVHKREAVASWLHQVARRTALTLRARRDRRTARERPGGAAEELPAPSDPCTEPEHKEARAIVDEEVSRLPERLRAPVILCYFEGKTVDEAALLLDCPRGTVASRLVRARERLRRRLARRGLGLAVGLVVVRQADAGSLSVMLPLIRAAVRQATGAIPSQVANLTREVMRAMLYQKVKAGTAVLALCAGILLAGGGLAFRLPAHAQEEPQPPGTAEAPKGEKAKAQDKPATPAAEPAPVTVSHPLRREVAPYEDFTGRLEALQTVEVRAPVSGWLTAVNFKAGADVKKGDLLFAIDQRPYQATLNKAVAGLTLAEAQRKQSEADLERVKRLLGGGNAAVSREDYDKAVAQAASAEAAVKTAQAEVQQARLKLEATEVRAPVAGRVGLTRVEPGNLVSGGDRATLLVTITALDPIGLSFDMDERNYLRYQRLLRDKEVKGTGSALNMKVVDENGFPHEGTLEGFDHQVNPQTGTVRVRGRFANPGGLLLPGMHAAARMSFGRPRPVLEVPERAVRSIPGDGVLVVNARNVVEWRDVKRGKADGDRRIIDQGLRPEDWVIVGGDRAPRPGDRVQPKRLKAPERKE